VAEDGGEQRGQRYEQPTPEARRPYPSIRLRALVQVSSHRRLSGTESQMEVG